MEQKKAELADLCSTFLSDEDIVSLIHSCSIARNGEAVSDEDAINLISWAENTILSYRMLTLVLEGRVNIDWKNGEPYFRTNLAEPHEQFSSQNPNSLKR